MRNLFKLLYCCIVVSLMLFVATPVFALNVGTDIAGKAATQGGYAEATDTTLAETAGLIISIVLAFTGVIFLGLMVFAGILWMTAAGEEEKIKKAQKIILATIVGLVIVVGAFLITNYLVPAIIAATKGGKIGLSMATPVFAADEVKKSAMEQINAAAGKAEIDTGAIPTQMVIINAIIISLGFVGIIFVGLIVYGGFLLFTSSGEEEKVKKGTNIIKGAVIGFIIVMLSYAITTFIGNRINPLVSQGGVVEK